MTLVTCQQRDCLLSGVTLEANCYDNLTEPQREAYRQVNRANHIPVGL